MQLRIVLCVIAWFIILSNVVSAIPLNVKDYGAIGDGVTDDTVAIQAAVNTAGTNGAVLDFPAGTYIVSIVKVQPGVTFRTKLGDARAVIKTKPDSKKFTRCFTTTFNRYFGSIDSAPLIFSNLEFDGNLVNQGSYQNYELEHQAAIFAMADKESPGRLVLIVENCDFHDGAADAIGVSDNVYATITNCTAFEYFRGGITCGSGGTEINIYDFKSGGVSNRAGLQIEVDSAGYNGNLDVDITASNIDLDGGFDLGFKDGGSFVGTNIILRRGPFFVYAKGATVRISDSVFSAGSPNRSHIFYPNDVEFDNCRFIASREPDDTASDYSPVRIYFSLASSGISSNQICAFRNCSWEIGGDFQSGDTKTAVYLSADRISLNNRLVIENSTIDAGYEKGIHVKQGGDVTLRNLQIGADEAVRLAGSDSYNDYYFNAILDNVTFINGVIISEFLAWDSPSNSVTHRNMVLDESMNRLGTQYGLTDNSYHEGRIILGVDSPTNTPGLLGDWYWQKKPLQNTVVRWHCIASHQTAATWQVDPNYVLVTIK